MKLLLIAILAFGAAFISKTDDWTTLGCYSTEAERDEVMNEVVTSMTSGPYTVFGVETFSRAGFYCFKIHSN